LNLGIAHRRKGDLFMIDSHARSNMALIVGVIAIGLALMETLSGDALLGYGQMTSRGKDPKTFWRAVALHYFCGVAGIGYHLYERFLTN
jgi:hypothetical protein